LSRRSTMCLAWFLIFLSMIWHEEGGIARRRLTFGACKVIKYFMWVEASLYVFILSYGSYLAFSLPSEKKNCYVMPTNHFLCLA
jgi:hypothetical protein